MVGLLGLQPGTSNFLGDALSGIGAGLLAYGGGGPYRQQAGLIGLQGLQQAQQMRRQQAMDALQMQYMQQRGADFAAQAAERQQQLQRDAQQRASWNAFVGGQPRQGPVQPGQPALGNSPINPVLSSLSPQLQQMLPAMDPQQGIGLIAQLATQKPQTPNIEHWREGNQEVSGWIDAQGNKHVIGSGAAFAPQQEMPKFGMSPVWGKDAQGNPVLLAMGANGTVIQPALPAGVTPAPGLTSIDTGTGTALANKQTGQIQTVVPKNIAEKSALEAAGTAQGTAQFNLPTAVNSIDTTIGAVNDLKKDPNLDSALGFFGQFQGAIPGTKAYGVRQRINQIAGQSFLAARQQLKGGGQITDYEGGKAEQALARLNAAQTKEDFLKALDDFTTHLSNAREILVKQAGGQAGATTAPPSPAANDTQSNMLNDARDAIKRGADPEAVKKRLRENNIDPSGL